MRIEGFTFATTGKLVEYKEGEKELMKDAVPFEACEHGCFIACPIPKDPLPLNRCLRCGVLVYTLAADCSLCGGHLTPSFMEPNGR